MAYPSSQMKVSSSEDRLESVCVLTSTDIGPNGERELEIIAVFSSEEKAIEYVRRNKLSGTLNPTGGSYALPELDTKSYTIDPPVY